jgi:hypothetical protein
MSKKKVIIWKPFPSPTVKKRDGESTSVLDKAVRLTNRVPKEQSEIDEETFERWTKLADIVMSSPNEEETEPPAESDEKMSA